MPFPMIEPAVLRQRNMQPLAVSQGRLLVLACPASLRRALVFSAGGDGSGRLKRRKSMSDWPPNAICGRNIGAATPPLYSGLMPADLMIGHHFSISAFCIARSASGV